MGSILDTISGPADLKVLAKSELKKLAAEIREFLIENISVTGGHLASNLGTVELTVALHYHLNSPRDKIVWDVGHQAYTHKILTGRKDRFDKLRQKDGLSGYLKKSESIHDIIEAGHTSTSISSALGLALARDLQGKEERIYSVIGDGAMTSGMAFEALNHAGDLAQNIKVILNENEMSIAPNTGALSQYLSKIRTDPQINKLESDLEKLIEKVPRIGSAFNKSVDRLKDALAYTFISGVLFEEMGFTYIGPLDGHHIPELIEGFKRADQVEGPVLLHVKTEKGKGYTPAEENPDQYHGVGPFTPETGESKTTKKHPTYSQIFGQTMVKMGRENEELVGITAAMPKGTCLDKFASEFPERTFDVGIAEQHAVTLAAGLARGGQQPVFTVYSTFLQRAVDQVLHDVCLQKLPVTLALDRAGIVGRDGETHQGVFDFSYLRMIPNITIMAPKDENELQHMLYTAVEEDQPVAVRYPRGEGRGVKLDQELSLLPTGEAEYLHQGEDVLLIAIGSRVYPALEAAELLQEEGVSTGVINARYVKPLDRKLLLESIPDYDYVLTVEEQVLNGGFGSAVLELINESGLKGVNFKRIGLPDEFIPQGGMEEMRREYGLDSSGIVKTVQDMM
ncbi:MAG: 1-deoxy-D-xylulose-5-phosphate synthase [Bacillota bacterium]